MSQDDKTYAPHNTGVPTTHIINKKDATVPNDRDTWFDSKALKALGVVFTVLAVTLIPLCVWLVVSVMELRAAHLVTEIHLQQMRKEISVTDSLRAELATLNDTIKRMATDIAVIKAKGNIP